MDNGIIEKIKKCNVTYHSLGKTDRSAMPLGNGELCTSVWADGKGRICFYVSRSDALTEWDRTVKLGMVRVDLKPNPFMDGTFTQELDVADGCIKFSGNQAEVKMIVDKDSNTIMLHGNFGRKTDICAEYVNWRTEPNHMFAEFGYESELTESADITEVKEQGTLFYHKNGENIIYETAKNQEMDDCLEVLPDFLTNRIFGGMLSLEDGEVCDNIWIKKNADDFTAYIFTESIQGDVAEFEQKLFEMHKQRKEFTSVENICRDFWNDYWQNSYVFVENDKPSEPNATPELYKEKLEPTEYTTEEVSSVTGAYVWTRFMLRCCGDGAFPILYNGMLFNLCPGKNQHFSTLTFGEVCTAMPGELTKDNNPDERTWCVEHLWQNIRHPYHTFLAQGNPELMKPMFAYYKRFWELNRRRAQKYYHAEGQHNTEMTMSFGLQSIGIYGADRTGKPAGYADNRHGGSVDISPGLELVAMMLDYYDYTKDVVFLKEEIQVYAKDLLRYIETRFPKRENAKIVIEPLNSIETYWDAKNPIPVLAGLYDIIGRLLETHMLDKEAEDYFREYLERLPEIPHGVEDGREILKPAQGYDDERHNVEIPELYACFPFETFRQLPNGTELMKHTFEKRLEQYGGTRCFCIGKGTYTPSYSGWQYHGLVAARLGMTDMAKQILTDNVQQKNPGTRFPAMWGPIYDGVPDTDHGANIVHLLQEMIMQVYDGKISILPAFPEDWNLKFKLHADCNTVVEGCYENGQLKDFKVFPESARERVVMSSGKC